MSLSRQSLLSIASLVFISCTQLPEMQAPKAADSVALPKNYGKTNYQGMEVSSGLNNLFTGDPLVKKYTSTALSYNANLQASAARLEEAGYQFKIANASRYPVISNSSSLSRSQRAVTINSSNNADFSTSIDVNWEVDVWGRLKHGAQAAKYDQAAVWADHQAAKESLYAQTLQAYFTLIGTKQLKDLAKRNHLSLKRTYDLIDNRFQNGNSSLSELDLAKTDLSNAQAQWEAAQNTYEQSARDLSELMGKAPQLITSASTWPILRNSIPTGVPSDLLRNRPDIYAAYLRILSSDEQIKVAHKDLLPTFSLSSSFGSQSSVLTNLISGDYNTFSIAAGVTTPIFAAGSLKAELGASSARSKEALANYREILLNALKEVENAIGSEYYLKKQQLSTQTALISAKRAEERIRMRYEKGLDDLLTLLETQRRSFTTEESLINITMQRYLNRVALALALGKGL